MVPRETVNFVSRESQCQVCYIAGSFLLPSDVTDFAMLPAQRFWRETVHC